MTALGALQAAHSGMGSAMFILNGGRRRLTGARRNGGFSCRGGGFGFALPPPEVNLRHIIEKTVHHNSVGFTRAP